MTYATNEISLQTIQYTMYHTKNQLTVGKRRSLCCLGRPFTRSDKLCAEYPVKSFKSQTNL